MGLADPRGRRSISCYFSLRQVESTGSMDRGHFYPRASMLGKIDVSLRSRSTRDEVI